MFKIKDITNKDLEKVSLFIKDNFLNFPPYKDFLTEKELEWFSYLNSPIKLLEKINNKNYIYIKYITNEKNDVVWVCFAELEKIEINNKEIITLCIKRMHWYRDLILEWIYERIYKEIYDFVIEYNKETKEKIDYLTVVPSNIFIKNFFLEKEFIKIKTHFTNVMKGNNIPEVALLWKQFN